MSKGKANLVLIITHTTPPVTSTQQKHMNVVTYKQSEVAEKGLEKYETSTFPFFFSTTRTNTALFVSSAAAVDLKKVSFPWMVQG